MIPAPAGIHANYKLDNGRWTHSRVVAFDDDGDPYIVWRNGLVNAKSRPGFGGLEDFDDEYSSLIPGAGWSVVWTYDDGSTETQPVIGWAVKNGWSVVPLVIVDDVSVEDLDMTSDKYRLVPPAVE